MMVRIRAASRNRTENQRSGENSDRLLTAGYHTMIRLGQIWILDISKMMVYLARHHQLYQAVLLVQGNSSKMLVQVI